MPLSSRLLVLPSCLWKIKVKGAAAIWVIYCIGEKKIRKYMSVKFLKRKIGLLHSKYSAFVEK